MHGSIAHQPRSNGPDSRHNLSAVAGHDWLVWRARSDGALVAMTHNDTIPRGCRPADRTSTNLDPTFTPNSTNACILRQLLTDNLSFRQFSQILSK
jgi:hypothetical protein